MDKEGWLERARLGDQLFDIAQELEKVDETACDIIQVIGALVMSGDEKITASVHRVVMVYAQAIHTSLEILVMQEMAEVMELTELVETAAFFGVGGEEPC